MGKPGVPTDEGTRDMTDTDSDAAGAPTGSVLVTGPAPERFERATELVTDEVVVVPGVDDRLDESLATADADVAVVPESGGAEPLSELGISVSDRVARRSEPDVLVSGDALADAGSVCPFTLFRFLHLTRWRVAGTGGRLVCTLGDAVDPITIETIDEVFDERVRLESIRDRRRVGGLLP